MKNKFEAYNFSYKNIHGQKLFFLTITQWQKIFENFHSSINDSYGLFDNKNNLYLLELIRDNINEVEKYNELSLGIGFLTDSLWLPYVILHKNNEDYRIFLEKINCNNCHWSGKIGNAFIMDNYLGISDKFNEYELRREARELLLPCPICNHNLSRPAIWIAK